MAISVNEIVTGRKTFFILPDTSLMPETFLEDYFALGYECYYVAYDKRVNLAKKIKVITSLFKDFITHTTPPLFYCIIQLNKTFSNKRVQLNRTKVK